MLGPSTVFSVYRLVLGYTNGYSLFQTIPRSINGSANYLSGIRGKWREQVASVIDHFQNRH